MKTTSFVDRGNVHRAVFISILLLLGWMVALPLLGASLGTPPPPGVAPVLEPAGGFAIDGNLMANQPDANTGDWLSGAGGTGAGVMNNSGAVLNPSATFHLVDAYNGNDDTFAGGLKWWDDPNTWAWTTGKASSKTDINNVMVHITTDAQGHIWAIIAADRLSTSGDAYIDFEFLQNTLTKNSNGTFTSMGPNSGRTANDLLLCLAFTSGGSVANFFAWRWQLSANGYTYVDATAALPTGRVFAALNTANVTVPYGAFGATTYAPNSFAEAAVDLTALLGNFDSCMSLGIKTIMVKTKTSAADSATVVDLSDPIQYNLRIGPSTDAGADQMLCSKGATNIVLLSGKASPGMLPIQSTTWSVISGDATIDSPNALVTTSQITSSSAVFRLTAVEADGCTVTSDMTVTVLPAATCSIDGPTTMCPRSTNQFQSLSRKDVYSWSVNGNATILGPTNAQVVTVVAGNSCGESYSLLLKTISNGCEAACSADILVIDQNRPAITAPPDVVLECPANTSTSNTGVATAQDDCNRVTVTYEDAVTTTCANTKTINRTWTATDECGNTASAVQVITVRDSIKPVLTIPAAVTQECPGDVSTAATGMATATDACGSVTITYEDTVVTGCGSTKVVSRTWTATDECGNTTSAVQTIAIRDTTKPVLQVPADVMLECPADTSTSNTGMATATDTCGSATVTYVDAVTDNCAGTKVITRTWTATDDCGNTTSGVQKITVGDTLKPVLIVPADVTLECPADTSTNVTGVASATDACSQVTVTFSDAVSNTCSGANTILRTWTASDQCGNSVSAVQKIVVEDSIKPVLTVPADVTLQCPADTGTNTTGVATATDGCSQVTVRYSDAETTNCGNTKVILRTWTASDECGNSVSAVQTITVIDTTKPALTIPADLILECPADTRTNATGVAIATDACSQVTVTFSDVVSNSCTGAKTILRTWTASDQCGNTSSAMQKITVVDSQNPILVCPADVTLQCPADTTTNATGLATATDGCSQVTIRYSDAVTSNCGNTKVIARTWTATDECGNHVSAMQTITVLDTVKPVLVCPADVTLECPANTSTNATGVATATDACSEVTISYSDSVSSNCGNTKVIARTWTARDACGNSVSAVQTITVRDTTAPTLRLPANVVLECPGDTRTNVTGVATATDGCGAVTVTYSDVVSNSCGLTKTVLRLWTATDQCGNSTNGLQTIVVADTRKPTITCPSISVQCVDDVPPAYPDLASFLAAGGRASDSCDAALTFLLVSDSGLVGKCPGTVTRVYRVADSCGNFADGTQRITVDDTTPPVLTIPTNVTVECGSSLEVALLGQATATDNCSTNVTIAYTDTAVASEYNIRLYAADPEPNKAPYLPTYAKLGPASLSPLASARLAGRAADPLRNAVAYGPTANTLDALTSMGGAPMCFGQIVPFEAVIDASGAPGPERGIIEFTATWATHTTSNDRFGYDTNYMVYAAFVDTADPGLVDPNYNARVESYSAVVINKGTINEQIQGTFRISGLDPGDRVVVEIWVVLMSRMEGNGGGTIATSLASAQKATVPPTPITVGVQTTSIGNLSKLSPLPAAQQQGPEPAPAPQAPVPPGRTISVFDRAWTATDDCGNARTATQRITVRDTTGPVLTAPDVVLECPADTSTNAIGAAVAQDLCGSLTALTYNDVTRSDCGGSQIITRAWTAVDDSGNSNSVVQTITIRDTQPPTLICPADVTLECPAGPTPANAGMATATDACSATTISYNDEVTTNCGNTRVIKRTWTATDECGNTVSAVQTITLRDTQRPTLVCPADIVLSYPAETSTSHTGVATATDTCSQTTVGYADVETVTCGVAKVIRRTWTATDACGNSVSAEQTITVTDTEAPTLVCGAGQSVQYGDSWQFSEPTAQDNSGEVSVIVLSTVTNSVSESTLVATRTWQASDPCGNQAACQQTVTMQLPATPSLQIKYVQPDLIVLQWPATAVGYQLQTTSDYKTWTSVSTPPVVTNGYYVVTLKQSYRYMSFRLAFPKLEIRAVPPQTVELRWPAAAIGYELQASANLKTWSTVLVPATLSSNYNIVVLKQGQYQDFRLNKAQ